jgi:UDP-N-acetyl-alpha-D-muramoyl-L-alanyl-L-glutamate epimerase
VPFHPDDIDRFRIVGYEADPVAGRAFLRYALDDRYNFEERIYFGRGVTDHGDRSAKRISDELTDRRAAGFERVIRLLHLAAGVSYYKAAAPRRIFVETGPLSDLEAAFCRDLYDRGLREFAYRNHLKVPRDIVISAQINDVDDFGLSPTAGSLSAAPASGVCVPIGGGKDSIVVLEALRDLDPVLVSVNPNAAAVRIASVADMDLFPIERTLDPLLLRLNEQGALNGHIPVTAIVSLISVAAGYIYGYDTTAMALENSADEPTRVVGAAGEPVSVNHQWSKSAEFETQLHELLRASVHPSLRFLSPLRAFSELEITSAFATLPKYFGAFRSCNRVARISDPSDAWCLDCPKCRFVYLALATRLKRRELVGIFGGDLFADASQVQGYREMLDPDAKPFDCVGTVEEVKRAFRIVLDDSQWSETVVLDGVGDLLAQPAPSSTPPASATEVFEGARRTLTTASVAGGVTAET